MQTSANFIRCGKFTKARAKKHGRTGGHHPRFRADNAHARVGQVELCLNLARPARGSGHFDIPMLSKIVGEGNPVKEKKTIDCDFDFSMLPL